MSLKKDRCQHDQPRNIQIANLYKNASILLWYTPYSMKDPRQRKNSLMANEKIKVSETNDKDVPYLDPPDLQDSGIKKRLTEENKII